jgi:sulfate permease, SulP family
VAEKVVDPRAWAAPKPSGVARWMPLLRWLPGYDRGWLRSDIIAGTTVWGLLVPEMIAYAGLAGLPPQAGLYTLLVAPVAYAVFGTSRHLVAAGTSAAAVLLAAGVADVAAPGSADYVVKGAALVMLCGCVFLAAGVLRLGFVAQFLSRPVMEGFVFGLALFVTVKQLPKLFGIESGDGNTIRQFLHLLSHLGDTSGITLIVGVASLGVLFGSERYAPRVPGGLLVLGLGIAISWGFDLSQHGVAVVGKVPSGLPSVGVPDIAAGDLATLFAAAAGMALVIFSESLGAAENFARKHGYQIDPTRNSSLLASSI